MSKWDEIRRLDYGGVLDNSRDRGLSILSNASFEYTFFYPSDQARLWDLLCLGQRDIWSIADFHDLARFVEDFVLCDRIGVPNGFLEYVGPHLCDSYGSIEEFPLFAFDKQLYRLMLTSRAAQGDDVCRRALSEPGIIESESLWIKRERAELEEVLSGDTAIRPVDRMCEMLKRQEAYIRLLTIELRISAIYDFQDEDKNIQEFFNILSESSNHFGIAISPGWKFRKFFLGGKGEKTLSQRLYSKVESVHQEQIDIIESWTKPRRYHVPPLLSILLNQTADRDQLPQSLVNLRDQFADLRKVMTETNVTLAGDLTLKERLDLIRSLESARELILKKAVHPNTSIIRRTWDVVKNGTMSSIAIKLADLILEWDSERRLVGGIRHFIDLERLALNIRDEESNVRRLFGEIAEK